MFQVSTFISLDNNNKILNILAVKTSYVYFGSTGRFFPFHIEDINLASINRQYYGLKNLA
jgi:hypothetical protein